MGRLALTAAALVLLAAAPAGGVSAEQEAEVWAGFRLRPDGGRSLLLRITTPAGTSCDALILRLPRGAVRRALPGHLPEGWELAREGREARLTGAPQRDTLFIRLELAAGSPFPTPLKAELLSGGRSVASHRLEARRLVGLEETPGPTELVVLPPLISAGETIELFPEAGLASHPDSRWIVAGSAAREALGRPGAAGRRVVHLAADLEPGNPVEVTYVNPWGERRTAVDDQVRVVPRGAAVPPRPLLSPCLPQTVARGLVCLCGWFPNRQAREGIRMDGEALGAPQAASDRSVCFPAVAGTHRFTGDPEAGFPAAPGSPLEVVTVEQPPRRLLQVGETAAWSWQVHGTTEPVRLRLRNLDPEVAWVDGGSLQVLTSTGGEDNRVTRVVTRVDHGTVRIRIVPLAAAVPFLADGHYQELLLAAIRRDLGRLREELRQVVPPGPDGEGGEPPAAPSAGGSPPVELLDRAETALLEAVAYPDLAALRGAVRSAFARVREELAAGAEALQAPAASRPWGAVTELLDRLLAPGLRLTRELCPVSSPGEARVEVLAGDGATGPQEGPQEGIAGAPLTVPVGLLRYRVSAAGHAPAQGVLDLLRQEGTLLECDLAEVGAGLSPPCRLGPDPDNLCAGP